MHYDNAFLISRYPCWSETFVRQDLTLLMDMGLRILPVSIFPGDIAPEPDWPTATYLHRTRELGGNAARKKNAKARLLFSLIPPHMRGFISRAKHRRAYHSLCTLLYENQVQHIHAEFADLPALLATAAARRLQIGYSVSVHAHDVHVPKYAPQTLFQHAAFVVACNGAARDALLQTSPWVSERLHLIPHGLCLDEWPFLANHSVAGCPLKVLFVGRLVEKKGVDQLLRAVSLAERRGIPLELTCIGGGPLQDQLEKLAGSLGIEQAVNWTGVFGRAEVGRRMRQADCLVVPSRVDSSGNREGIPNVVLEAMALGIPVIAARTGSVGDVVSAETGWPYSGKEPEDLLAPIQNLLGNPRKRQEKRVAARKLVESRYDARILIRRKAALFEKVNPPHEHN